MRKVTLAALLLAGCELASFDPQSLLHEPRVLAVQAAPPSLAAGEMTTLRALHHPEDGLSLEWAACTLPAVPGGDAVNLGCVTGDAGPDLVTLGSGDSVPFTMPLLPPALAEVLDDTGAAYLPIRIRSRPLHAPTMAPRVDVYRLRYQPSAADPRNHNPTLLALRFALDDPDLDEGASPCADDVDELDYGAPIDEPPAAQPLSLGDRAFLVPVLAPGSAEPVTNGGTGGTGGTRCEALEIRWYATAGYLLHEATGPHQRQSFSLEPGDLQGSSASSNGRHPAPGDRVDLYAVVRDGRGGASWLHRVFLVTP